MARALIPPRVMRQLRALSESAMPDTAVFRRPGQATPNGRGGVVPGAPTLVATPCRVLEGAGDEDDADELRRAGATRRLFVPAAFAVGEADEVTSHTLNGVAVAEVWRVVYAPPPNSYSADRVVGLTKG